MKLEKRKTDELKFYPGNPRKMDRKEMEKLKKSISEFGLVDPLIVNKDNEVIGGNQRLKVIKTLGIKEVDVVVVDLPKSKEKALNIALNRISGEFDEGLLKNFIDDIEPLDLKLTGLDDKEISLLDDNVEVQEDEYQEPEDIEVTVKKGDVYQLGNHRLMCGDATIKEDVEKLMNGEKADMVFTDPPYGVNYQSNMRTKSKKFGVLKNDNLVLKEWIKNAILYSTGWILFFTDWKIIEEWIDAGKQIGKLTNMIIWDIGKDNPNTYKHPTQKPVKLSSLAIETLSKGSILDLFGGSGSTLIASEQLGRKCYMMEIDPYYCQVIIDRWEKFTGKKAVKL